MGTTEGRARIGMDASGVVTTFDEGAEMLFGYRGEDVIGRTVAELIVPPELRAGHRLLVELTIASAAEQDRPARFIGTISVVGAHSATDRPSPAER